RGAVDVRAGTGGALQAGDADAAVDVVLPIAATQARGEGPGAGLVLEHHAGVAAVAFAADAAVVAAQVSVLVGDRTAEKPARADLALPAELVRHAIQRKARHAAVAILVGAQARHLAPKAVLLAGQRVAGKERGTRHHGAGEARHAGLHLRGRRYRHAGRQI